MSAPAAVQTARCTGLCTDCISGRKAGVVEYHPAMDASRIRRPSTAWLWIYGIWLGVGLVDATQTVFVMRAEGMHHAWVELWVTLLLSWLPWAASTPLVVRLGRRYPVWQQRRVVSWMAHLGLCVAIGVVGSLWMTGLELLLNPWAKAPGSDRFLPLWVAKVSNGFLASVILYVIVLAIAYLVESRQQLASREAEAARLNEQLSKAQLNALRRQIEPHFLFNTLNAIAGLIREGRNDTAVDMIAGLSDFLRRVLEDSSRQQVPLGEELRFVQRYLDIQKARFGDRLRLGVDVPASLVHTPVPALILQPMVENAVEHGVAKRVQGGTIEISASSSNGLVTICVYNDGPALPADWEKTRAGIGLSNVRTRLQGLYGDAFTLNMRNRELGGVEASVCVPSRGNPA